jgi:prephenate dehydrogenase
VIHRLAIVGVGLLGGSAARAARARGLADEIVGIGRDPGRLEPALRDGVLTGATADLAAGVREADLVILAAPVAVNERLLPEVWAAAAPEAVITDVGSTKAGIVAVARRLHAGRPRAFVGAHPMAGSEQSGYAAARADLFQGATVVVTPTETTEPRALKAVVAFWEAVGAGRVLTLDADTHDRLVGAVSHLPHLVACALVAAVEGWQPAAFDLAARGFRDTTRVAAGDPELWRDIFLANREAVIGGARAFSRALDELAALIERGEAAALQAALARIRERRERLA